MTTVESPTRKRDAACPPWCSGHEAGWLPWEWDIEAGRNTRDHASPTFSAPELADICVNVELIAEENPEDGVQAAEVALYADCERLTASEARQLAAALLEAASVLEDAQAVAR